MLCAVRPETLALRQSHLLPHSRAYIRERNPQIVPTNVFFKCEGRARCTGHFHSEARTDPTVSRGAAGFAAFGMQREQVRTSQIRLRLDLFGKLWLKVKTGSLRPYRAVVTPAVSDAVFAGATNRAAESRLAVHVALARQWERARQGMDKVPPPKRQVRQIKAGCLGFARPGHSVRRCTACKQRHRSRQTKVSFRWACGHCF